MTPCTSQQADTVNCSLPYGDGDVDTQVAQAGVALVVLQAMLMLHSCTADRSASVSLFVAAWRQLSELQAAVQQCVWCCLGCSVSVCAAATSLTRSLQQDSDVAGGSCS